MLACVSVHEAHAAVAPKDGTQGFSAVFWCDPHSVHTNKSWNTSEVRGPIRKHMKKLSHSDVTACENLVTIQPVTFNCLSFLFGYFAPGSPIPAERFPLSHYWLRHLQRWQLKNANKREIFALVFVVSTSPSLMKRQFPCNTEKCFCFLSGCLLFWPLQTLLAAFLCWYFTS